MEAFTCYCSFWSPRAPEDKHECPLVTGQGDTPPRSDLSCMPVNEMLMPFAYTSHEFPQISCCFVSLRK